MKDNFEWLQNSGLGNTYSFLQQIDIEQEELFLYNIKNQYNQIKNELLQSYDELNMEQQKLLLDLINVRIDAVKNSTTLKKKEERLIYLDKIKTKWEELTASNRTSQKIKTKKEYSLNTQLLMLERLGLLEVRKRYSDVKLSKILSVILNKSEQNIREALGQNDRYKQKGPIEEFRRVCNENGFDELLAHFEKEIRLDKK